MRQTGRERFLHLKTRQLFRRIRRHGPWLPSISQGAAGLPPEIRMPDDCRLHQPMGTQNREQHIRLHFTRMPGDAGTDNLRPERGGQNDHVCLCGCHFSGRKWSSGCNGRCRKRMGIVMKVLIILFSSLCVVWCFSDVNPGSTLLQQSHTDPCMTNWYRYSVRQTPHPSEPCWNVIQTVVSSFPG